MRVTGAKESAQSRCWLAVKPSGIGVAFARAADHWAIHSFLRHIFQQPAPGEYQAQLDEPAYEPTDRLLIHRGPHLVAHLRLLYREMRFGGLTFPTAWIADLATLPEFRGQGCASALLAAAEQRLRDEDQVAALLRTDQPRFYARRGWVVCGGPTSSVASPQRVLSQTQELAVRHSGPFTALPRPLHIRYWRHFERAALMRLYREGTEAGFGPSARREAYWQWLVARRAYDRILVALEGTQRPELNESLTALVGYAVVKDSRVVELMAAARRPDAAERLLARACSDALESVRREIRLEAPPDDPLHKLILAAGGAFRDAGPNGGPIVMVRLFDPPRFVSRLGELFGQRLQAAGLDDRCELRMLVGDERYVLHVSRRGARLTRGAWGRSYLACQPGQLVQLLLGHADVPRWLAAGRITATTQRAADTAAILFPQLPLWYPPLDDLPADK